MKTIIFGTKEISQLANFYLSADTDNEPCSFCEDGEFIENSIVESLPVIPFEEIELHHTPDSCVFFVPLYDNFLREKKCQEVIKKGYKIISYISSKANIFTKEIGFNCFIMEGNNIQPHTKIGNSVILWSGNHIGHHSLIKNNIFFSSHVVLSGKCLVEDYSWFGVNSCIKDGIKISEGSFIGMGSVVTKNTKAYKKYIGNPAKEYGEILKQK